MDAETGDRPAPSDEGRSSAAAAALTVDPPYDVLTASAAWRAVFDSVGRHSQEAFAMLPVQHTLTSSDAESLEHQVLSLVVTETIEHQPVATLLALHRAAVEQRLVRQVAGTESLPVEVTLLEARRASSAALLAVEAGVYGVVGDVVRSSLAPRG
jgi:hypothetical protein